MGDYSKLAGMSRVNSVSVSAPIREEMRPNIDGGGFAWEPGIWAQMRRWLILGSDGNSFYATARKLTEVNAKVLLECLSQDYIKYINLLVEMRSGGIAPKTDTVIFALALVYTKGSNQAKAYARENITNICRTAANLQEFSVALTGKKVQGVRMYYMRGWGRAVRSTIEAWLTRRSVQSLVYQAIKYRSRHGTSMKTLVQLSHPNPGTDTERSAVYKWMISGSLDEGAYNVGDSNLAQLWAFEVAKRTVNDDKIIPEERQRLIDLVSFYRLPWEAVPTQWLKDKEVLAALVVDMPIIATVRNLSRLTRAGVLDMPEPREIVLGRLYNPEIVAKENIHPVKLLQAYITYGLGYGEGKARWTPVPDFVQALEDAFYLSFGNIAPTGLNRMVAIDVSASMDGAGGDRFARNPFFKNCSGLRGVTPREASAALALITMRTEPWHYIVGFSHGLVKLNLSPNMTLRQVITYMQRIPMGGTNIGAPIVAAANEKLPVDLFEVYTDNQANVGIHPAVALQRYQDTVGRNARSAFVAMVSYNDSVADPGRSDMMDFVGFDPTTPAMLARFARGEFDR